MVVSSFLPALKKRAAIPPKPQFVSRERTTKGKVRTLLVAGLGLVVSLRGRGSWGSLTLKGTMVPLPGTVSTGWTRICWANAEKVLNNSDPISRPALIYIYLRLAKRKIAAKIIGKKSSAGEIWKRSPNLGRPAE